VTKVIGSNGTSTTILDSVTFEVPYRSLFAINGRSMGATGRNVAQVFWTEGVGLGVISWLIAVIIGIPAAYGFLQLLSSVLLNSPFDFNPVSMLAMLTFIVALASLATIGPVWSASRVRIADTLRYE